MPVTVAIDLVTPAPTRATLAFTPVRLAMDLVTLALTAVKVAIDLATLACTPGPGQDIAYSLLSVANRSLDRMIVNLLYTRT
jgi:hypothetical protein